MGQPKIVEYVRIRMQSREGKAIVFCKIISRCSSYHIPSNNILHVKSIKVRNIKFSIDFVSPGHALFIKLNKNIFNELKNNLVN